MKLQLAVAALLSVGVVALVRGNVDQQTESVHWRQLFQHDVSMYARDRGPLDGAPGASAIGFRVSNEVQGTAIIVGLDRPALGVFVGLNAPSAYINEPYKDLRVEFTLADGATHVVKPDGGGGTAMLFHSPDGVPMSSLRMVGLYVDESADWTK